MIILRRVPDDNQLGWTPINYMVTLAAELLGAAVIDVPTLKPSRLSRITAVAFPRIRDLEVSQSCLMICADPQDLLWILNLTGWKRRFRFLAAWVIDSFWLKSIPKSFYLSHPFDQIFITSAEDIDEWKRIMGVPVSWLPWGTDALRLGTCNPTRDWDLTRVGRQPADWEDDRVTARLATRYGVRFRPRPAGTNAGSEVNQRVVMKAYSETKYLLAFSNIASPTSYTHPTRQYLTARWTDAIACGAVVAGKVPRERSIDALLWPDAILELPNVCREDGLREIASAMESWGAEIPAFNHKLALDRLDWRWRFQTIAQAFGEAPPLLLAEIEQLKLKSFAVSGPRAN